MPRRPAPASSSPLCDPRDNYTTDRFIEIFNSGPNAVDLAGDTVIAVANNVEVCKWPLSGTIAPGQAKVCGGPTTVTGFTVNFPSSVWATTAGYMNWNGKIGDGAKLKFGTTVVDIVVATGTLFENADLVRSATVTEPSAVYTPSEWTSTAVILATDASPGAHNGSQPPSGGPVVTNGGFDPAAPIAGENVDVEATVTDTSRAILGVTLHWGATSGSQPNILGMALLAGDTYRTTSPIPPQSSGASVFVRVYAEDSLTTSASALASYTVGGGGAGAPTVLVVGETSDSTLLVQFSEPVDPVSGETAANYTVGALVAVAAARDPVQTSKVTVTFRNLPAGGQTLTVNGVADLSANVAFGATCTFNYVDVAIPDGYYAGIEGLSGEALRAALHDIIKNHTVKSYDYALTAFATTDLKPSGKIWDMYSDVPSGTPPYEYAYGQTSASGQESSGYNREHSWPQSWFNSRSPMVSDLWNLYPTDAMVNNRRGNYPYGNVGSATWTSLNGSKVGVSSAPGYSGTVFEPIDAYKGDLARGQFYMATRYYTEDAGWDGSPAAAGANLVSWASAQYLQWSNADPPSWKERMRNGAVWVIQHNRNPFVDHPEFVALIYDPNAVSVGDAPHARTIVLRPSFPNPFAERTTIGFDLPATERVSLVIYDVTGRAVRVLADRVAFTPGRHDVEWNGKDDAGASLRSGVYFCRLVTRSGIATRRIALTR